MLLTAPFAVLLDGTDGAKHMKMGIGYAAVPTTDWGSPETLEYWRQTWAELCNAKFAEKGLDVSIDHRSYERQGVSFFPPSMRAQPSWHGRRQKQ